MCPETNFYISMLTPVDAASGPWTLSRIAWHSIYAPERALNKAILASHWLAAYTHDLASDHDEAALWSVSDVALRRTSQG